MGNSQGKPVELSGEGAFPRTPVPRMWEEASQKPALGVSREETLVVGRSLVLTLARCPPHPAYDFTTWRLRAFLGSESRWKSGADA